ncbi:LYR motif-containing protein 2 isoform X1 [Rousettus aegyptiacus]|uniref:LYR motif-containing protein 2 isoform X1 n=1 Tax=Rousettus aegyptiacus TaxID=9407 RepID=UPI000789737D|nr:LYR motif-containing protein 2 isoform X1 [Rousettus aegyptiacus]
MATSRLPPATLTLKQFLRRQQVLLLYRRILQAIRQVPNDSDRKYLKDWAREEFKRNKSATEECTIVLETLNSQHRHYCECVCRDRQLSDI